MIVRLKADFKRKQGVPRKGFNSMIVRLKVTPAAAPIAVPMFQFYDSPIKSAQQHVYCCCKQWFQFYDSPIKSVLTLPATVAAIAFQFYDSPIKSRNNKGDGAAANTVSIL